MNKEFCAATGCIFPPAKIPVVRCAISVVPPNCSGTSLFHTSFYFFFAIPLLPSDI